jgi:hypothetical protein
MKRLFTWLSVVALAQMLAVGGGLGYLWGTGRLDAEQVEHIAAILRGETDDAEPAPTTAPVTQPADESYFQAIADQNRQIREQEEIFRRQLERQIIEAAQTNALLDQVRIELMRESEALKQERDDFEAQLAASAERANTEGFQKDLELLSSLPAKLAKTQLMKRSEVEAARIIGAMPKRKATKVLEACQSAQEKEWVDKILQRINRSKEPESETLAEQTRTEVSS